MPHPAAQHGSRPTHSARLWLLLAVLVLLVLVILRPFLPSFQPPPPTPLPPATAAARAAASAGNHFALDLFARLRSSPGHAGNVVFAPYSVHTTLAMAREGAAGPTAAQLDHTLHLTEPIRAGQQDLHARLQAPGNHGFTLAIASRLWLDQRAALRPDFAARLQQRFLADAATLDLATAAPAINDWTAQHTAQRITSLVSPADLTPDTRVVLTNAVYFKGNWKSAFKPSATTEGDFFLAPSIKVRARLMSQREEFDFADLPATDAAPAFRALSLPYAGDDLAMLLLLPDLGALDQLEAALTPALLERIVSNLEETKLPVTLPRFAITSALSLQPDLVALGLTLPFDRAAADFSPLATGEGLYLTAVLHQATLEVTEEGTEAAAATAIAAKTSAPPPHPPEFPADHPFLFLLRDRHTGAILFLGRLADPTKN